MQKLGPGVLGLGVLSLIVILLIFFVGVPLIIEDMVKDKTQLVEGSEIWDKWYNLSVPILFTFRVFNITNPDALEKGEKFMMQELGPYVYQEKRDKTIIETNDEDDTVTYDEKLTYTFRPDLSGGKEDDTINILNLPFVAVATIAKGFAGNLAWLPVKMLQAKGEKIVRKNVKVDDLIFRGINVDPLYQILVKLSPNGQPTEFQGNTFAFLNGKNATSSGVWRIKAGKKDHTTFGQLVSWNQRKELDFWTDKSLPASEQQYCNKLNGSDGTLHPPFVKKDRSVYIFHTLLCRSIYMKFQQEKVQQGIDGYQFVWPKDAMASPERDPENRCFCPKPYDVLSDQCFDGGYRIFRCHSDAPIILTKPHFMDGEDDPILSNSVLGMEPDREKHESEIVIEPISGILLKASIKVQANVELQALDVLPGFGKLPHTVIPFLWLDLNGLLDDENVDFIKDLLVKPLRIVEIAQWTLIALAILVIFAGLGILARRRQQSKST